MCADLAFDKLIEKLRKGDPDAARDVFERYARGLIALAGKRMDRTTLQKLDPEDIIQSVFRSFFMRLADNQYQLDDWDSLWSLLILITLRRCGYRMRYYRAACRNVEREISEKGLEDSWDGWQAIARDATPDEATMLTETLEEVMRGLRPNGQQIIELSLRGYPPPDISQKIGRSERSVYRTLELVRQRLQKMKGDSFED